jgi:hypothetical protein
MPKGLDYRSVGRAGLIIPTPLYVDDALLGDIVLGANAPYWDGIRRTFERQGMPGARPSVHHLYYLPAVIKFLDRREGIASAEDDYPEDGPDSFYP